MPGRRTATQDVIRRARLYFDEEVPATATAAAENETGTNMIDVAAVMNRYQRERNTQPVADPNNTPHEWRTVTYTNAIIPNNERLDHYQWQVANYQYDAQIAEVPAMGGIGYAVAGAPARCHKEPQATTPKGEFEMDAD